MTLHTIPSRRKSAGSPIVSRGIAICSKVSLSMKVAWPSSMNRNCISFSSRRTRSTVSWVRKRSLSLVPPRRSRSSTWANAPPFPGWTSSRFSTSQSLFWCSRTLPGLRSMALIFMAGLGGEGSTEANIGRRIGKSEGRTMQEWWRPEGFAARRGRLGQGGRILHGLRDFFAKRGFVEVDTPALQVSPRLQPHLAAFATTLHDPCSGRAVERYLHTSPEFAMKKLLVAGLPRIWQLAHVFRDGDRSATHHPEFAMLEWYRLGASYRDLMDECEALLRRAQAAAGVPALHWQGRSADVNSAWERITVAESFARYVGIDLLATIPDPRRPDAALLEVAASGIGIAPHPGDDWE